MDDDKRGQNCCLLENGSRCLKQAGNAAYNKRIQKLVREKRLKLTSDPSVRLYDSIIFCRTDYVAFMQSVIFDTVFQWS